MSELRKKSNEDLMKIVGEKREELRAIRFGIAGTSKKNVKQAFLAKKEVARILTEINARKVQTA